MLAHALLRYFFLVWALACSCWAWKWLGHGPNPLAAFFVTFHTNFNRKAILVSSKLCLTLCFVRNFMAGLNGSVLHITGSCRLHWTLNHEFIPDGYNYAYFYWEIPYFTSCLADEIWQPSNYLISNHWVNFQNFFLFLFMRFFLEKNGQNIG